MIVGCGDRGWNVFVLYCIKRRAVERSLDGRPNLTVRLYKVALL